MRRPHPLLPVHLILLLLPIINLAHATSTIPPPPFAQPPSNALNHVDLLIGNGGDTPNGSGGMIPSTAPPYAMTRWVAQNQVHYVSATPFNWTMERYMGVVGTRQPAIWMGESAPVIVVPGTVKGKEGGTPGVFNLQDVVVDFERRGLPVKKDANGEKQEVVSVGYYTVDLGLPNDGSLKIEQTATSRVAHLRFTFTTAHIPYILFEVSRPSIITSTPTNVTYPHGKVSLSPRTDGTMEVCGWSDERQDTIIAPISTAPFSKHFKGYFCARFDAAHNEDYPDVKFGVIQNQTRTYPIQSGQVFEGPLLSIFAAFGSTPTASDTQKRTVTLRIGTSFISEEQARTNIDMEIPDSSSPPPSFTTNQDSPSGTTAQLDDDQPHHLIPSTFENTAYRVRKSWADILDRIEVEVYVDPNSKDAQRPAGERTRDEVDLKAFWTGVVHTLQYPSEQHEYGKYYSGYDNQVHDGESYTGYSIWDTYRAQWAWQILFVPDRIPGMITSMLQDYQQSGWLPMWKNIVETNIMVGTHSDSLIAEAVLKGIKGFDTDLAWEAVWKDATVPPKGDDEVRYDDREENVDYEVRAGLGSVYDTKGWVADDVHSESASRTLDYAYDDYATYVLARQLNKSEETMSFLLERSLISAFSLFNDETGFMEARNANGSWAGEGNGWTEGDKWAYSFDVMHDVPGLISRRGGRIAFVKSLEEHFNGGHNDHTNEPSHHIPYLYALAGAAWKTQERVREIAWGEYKDGPEGLSGNEDCGQMSAWFIFSAMGFYPVNPVSGEYVVGSPLFERLTIHLPNASKPLRITALGARTKKYVKSLTIDGVPVAGHSPVITHDQIKDGAEVVFEMSDRVEEWGNDVTEVLRALGVGRSLEQLGLGEIGRDEL